MSVAGFEVAHQQEKRRWGPLSLNFASTEKRNGQKKKKQDHMLKDLVLFFITGYA
jgi:hypothetical protein